jgi:hypothetical protein
MVTGLRANAGAEPRGEWELHLTWATGRRFCDTDGDDEERRGVVQNLLEHIRGVFTTARDIVEVMKMWIMGGGRKR